MTVNYIGVSEAITTPFSKSFIINGLLPGGLIAADQYDIRMRLQDEPSTSDRVIQDCYFASFQEIVAEAQTHPGVALLSIRALATDQLSEGDIKVDCLVKRETVQIINPAGSAETKLADNPAWACYRLLNREYDGVNYSRLDYAAFQAWSVKCTQRGYKVNIYFDSSVSLRKALDMVSVNGRGVVSQLGSKFTCLLDLPEDTPVQRFLFTMGNIAADSFNEEWLPSTDRANAVEVTYYDKDLEYTRQMVEIYADDYDTSEAEVNKSSVTLYGCTDRDYAIMYGKFLLKCNKLLTLTSSWDADVDAIGCIPGDSVIAAHDIPQFGESGRIVSTGRNLLTYSEQFDNAAWTKVVDCAILSNQYTSPDGQITADRATFTTSYPGGNGAVFQIADDSVANTGRTFTGSVYVRSISGSGKVNFRIANQSGTIGTNFLDRVISAGTSCGDGWYRHSVTLTFPSDPGSTGRYLLVGGNTAGDVLAIWGAQLEEVSSVSPYILTTTAASDGITLDREVTLAASTSYVVLVRRINDDSSDLFAVATMATERTWDTVPVTLTSSTGGVGGAATDGAIVDSTEDGALVDSAADGAYIDTATAVYPGSVYTLGTTTNYGKLMRVLRIARAGDMRKKLVCLEYNADVYVDGVTY
jgi:hypothetical protein